MVQTFLKLLTPMSLTKTTLLVLCLISAEVNTLPFQVRSGVPHWLLYLCQLGLWFSAAGLLLKPNSRTLWLLFCSVLSPLIATAQAGPSPVHVHHLLWVGLVFTIFPKQAHLQEWSVRVVLAGVYFFPGLWKLWAGSQWLNGEIISRTMSWKWAQYWDLSSKPWLLEWSPLLAVSVLLFELSSPVLMCKKSTWYVISAIAFHWATSWAIGIHFPSLWLLMVCLLIPSPSQKTTLSEASSKEKFWLGLLLGGIFLAGITRSFSGFPFVCYPSFDTLPASKMPLLSISIVCDDKVQLLPYKSHMKPNNHSWATNWELLRGRNNSAFEAYWKSIPSDQLPCNANEVHFYHSQLDVNVWPPKLEQRNRLHSLILGP